MPRGISYREVLDEAVRTYSIIIEDDEMERGRMLTRVRRDRDVLRALAELVHQCEQLSTREPSYVAPLIHEIAAGFNPGEG